LTAKSVAEEDVLTYKRSEQAKKSPLFNAVKLRYHELLGFNDSLYLQGTFENQTPQAPGFVQVKKV
jgi:hypothetical protein